MNDNQEEPKAKLSRGELLAKARQAKADKAKARLEENKDKDINKIIEDLSIKEPKTKINNKKKVEVKELEVNKKDIEPEIIEEVVRIPANRRKKVIKRTIEIEESETDEEIVEEIVKIPKIRKEVKISRDEMKKKLIENNKQRLHNELFS